MLRSKLHCLILVLIAAAFSACSAPQPSSIEADVPNISAAQASGEEGAAQIQQDTAMSELAGTSWEMLEIQSMDDSSWTPTDPSRYTLQLEADGRAYMQLECNQGSAAWSSAGSNRIRFLRLASTSALCQDDGLSERYAGQFEYVRSYVLRDDHLFLATMADGAIIEFRPAE